jgi:hypothetical protein
MTKFTQLLSGSLNEHLPTEGDWDTGRTAQLCASALYGAIVKFVCRGLHE